MKLSQNWLIEKIFHFKHFLRQQIRKIARKELKKSKPSGDLSHNLKPYIKSCDTHVGRMIKSRDPLASGNTALIKSPYSHGKKNQTNGSTKKNRANISDYNHKLKWLHIYLYPHFTLVHKINTFCVKNIQVRISSAKSFDGFI